MRKQISNDHRTVLIRNFDETLKDSMESQILWNLINEN